MGWFIAFVFAGVVVFLYNSKKNSESTASQRPSAVKPVTKSNDDFAGSSVGSFFLLEELVDNPHEELQNQGEIIFNEDVLFFDTDSGDELLEEEFF